MGPDPLCACETANAPAACVAGCGGFKKNSYPFRSCSCLSHAPSLIRTHVPVMRRRKGTSPLYDALLVFLLICQTSSNSMLLERIQSDPVKFSMVMTGLALDSLYLSSKDMGVRMFNFSFDISNPVYPHSPTELPISMTAFMRYMLDDGTGKVTIKGFVTAETR